MGLLSSLLFAPFKAPVQASLWVAGKIAEAAEAQRNDKSALRDMLIEAERQLLAGEMSEAEYDEIETEILLRLRAIPG